MTVQEAIDRARGYSGGIMRTSDGYVALFFDAEARVFQSYPAADGRAARTMLSDLILARAVRLITGIPDEQIRSKLDFEALRSLTTQTNKRVQKALRQLGVAVPKATTGRAWR